MTDLRAISVRQPWAYAIGYLGKNIENRSRRYKHRGRTLIHASAGLTRKDYDQIKRWIANRGLGAVPGYEQLDRGAIVAVVDIVDGISVADQRASSSWWMGPYGLVLANARPLNTPVRCSGTVTPMFWKPDAATIAAVEAELA